MYVGPVALYALEWGVHDMLLMCGTIPVNSGLSLEYYYSINNELNNPHLEMNAVIGKFDSS